jgi:hypothetical protein
VDGRGPGETVALAGRSAVPVSVRVLAAPWVRVDRFALFVGKKAARTEAVPESRDVLRYEATFELPLSGPTQVMAVARGGGYDAPVVAVPGALPIGFTSAVHIDRAASAPVTSPPR